MAEASNKSVGQLAGRVVVVTGSGRGLGREHALYLARQGAHVVVNDLASDAENPAADVVKEIEAIGGKAVADNHSVTTWDSSHSIIQTALSEFGRLDGLVTNAGFLRDRMLVNMTEAEWDDIIKVHQYGTFFPLRHAAEYWRNESKAGREVNAGVVTTTAASGLHSNVGQTNYGPAKAAIALLTLVAGQELGRYGVRVNSISPLGRTRLTENAWAPAAGDFDDRAPKHVSPLVAWLLSPRCKANSQVYAVHGKEIHRYQPWTAVEAAHTDGDWSIELIEKVMEGWPETFVSTPIPGLPADRPKRRQ